MRPLHCFLMQVAASLALLMGLAMLDWGGRLRAEFVSVTASGSLTAGAVDVDFILGGGEERAADEVPDSPFPDERSPAQDFPLARPCEGAGTPSWGSLAGSSSAPLVELSHDSDREPPLPAGFIRAPQLRHFPDPARSSVFRPPRCV